MQRLMVVLSTVTLLSWRAQAARIALPAPTSPFLLANQIAPWGYTPKPTPGPDIFELSRRKQLAPRALSNTCGYNNGVPLVCGANLYCTQSSSYMGCCGVNGGGSFTSCQLFTACVDYNDVSAQCPQASCTVPIGNCPSNAPECVTLLLTTSSSTFSLAWSSFICSVSKTIIEFSSTLQQPTETSVQTSTQVSTQTSVHTVTATPTSATTPTSSAFTFVGTSTFTSASNAPSTIVEASSSAPATAAGASSSASLPSQTSTSGSHTGAIAGGVVGGVVGLALIAGLVAFILYRMKKKREEAAWDDAPEMSGNTYPT